MDKFAFVATLCVSVVLPLTWVHHTSAQARVHIRGRSVLNIQVARQDRGVVISGTLTDERLQPLSASLIIARFNSREESTRTRGNGTFELPVEMPSGNLVEFEVLFTGDRNHAGSTIKRVLDMERSPVRIEYLGEQRRDLDTPSLQISLQLHSDASVEGLQLRLSDEFENPLGNATADKTGLAQATLETRSLKAGHFLIHVSFPGDPVRTPADLIIPLDTFRAATLSLSQQGEELIATLQDSQGPLAQMPVGLFDLPAKKHLQTAMSDKLGQARFAVPTEQGTRVFARFDPNSKAWPVAHSNPLKVDASYSVPVKALLAMGVFVVPLLLLLAIRRQRPKETSPMLAKATAPKGVHLNQEKKSGTPKEFRISLRCVDTTTDEPISAMVMFEQDDLRQHIATDDDGRLELTLSEGAYGLEATAQGYATEAASFRVPHHGEWRNAEIRLESLRELATAPFRPVATHLISGDRFGHTTEQEVAQLRPHDTSLHALSEAVSEARYGASTPTETTISQIDEKARRSAHLLDN